MKEDLHGEHWVHGDDEREINFCCWWVRLQSNRLLAACKLEPAERKISHRDHREHRVWKEDVHGEHWVHGVTNERSISAAGGFDFSRTVCWLRESRASREENFTQRSQRTQSLKRRSARGTLGPRGKMMCRQKPFLCFEDGIEGIETKVCPRSSRGDVWIRAYKTTMVLIDSPRFIRSKPSLMRSSGRR